MEEYSKLLIEGHGENCPWKNKGCDGMLIFTLCKYWDANLFSYDSSSTTG